MLFQMMIMNKHLLWIIIWKCNLAILPKKEVKIDNKISLHFLQNKGKRQMKLFIKVYLKNKNCVQELKNKFKNIPSESLGFRATP